MFSLLFSCRVDKKNAHVRVAGHQALTNVNYEICDIYIIFERVFIIKKLSFRVVCLLGTRKGTCILDYFSVAYSKKNVQV